MLALVRAVRSRAPAFFLALSLLAHPSFICGQNPPGARQGGVRGIRVQTEPVSVSVSVRDQRGLPIESSALVRLYSNVRNYNVTSPTREVSTASFSDVAAGEYVVEVRCTGYKTATEQVSVSSAGASVSVYVYLHPESENSPANRPPSGVVMSPKLQNVIDKGLELMRKQHYEPARVQFAKAQQLAPSNSDVLYLLGTSELGLQHKFLARQDFEQALAFNPAHERALLALGELQLEAGETEVAIKAIEKAYEINGAAWRTHYLLASAYAKTGLMVEAESHANRAVTLGGDKASKAALLLGQIQFAEGKETAATETWKRLITEFPGTPAANEAKTRLSWASETYKENPKQAEISLPLPVIGPDLFSAGEDSPWAPPDIDSKEYLLAQDAPCEKDQILDHALLRLKLQLENFEKFTATERIEHQEIDRNGVPGPVKTKNFSYIVFVKPYEQESFYLEESRNGTIDVASFPTSLATTGLNSLGVSVVQFAHKNIFVYQCEGLSNMRGQAAWQIRFEEAKGTEAHVRQWKRNGMTYNVPMKGRIWVAATSYDLLRIETDLREPVEKLQLTRDHLLVDYGPVQFQQGNQMLWLPWNAEMYMELHRKRYHHKHLLTDYLLFEVDIANKVGKPKEQPPPAGLTNP